MRRSKSKLINCLLIQGKAYGFLLVLLLLPLTVTASPTKRYLSIRHVDFANDKVLLKENNGQYSYFRLREGKQGDWRSGLTLRAISFGDLTGDGKEEAVIALDVKTSGSMGRMLIYACTLWQGRPVIFWSFQSGDRAQGGLRKAKIHSGYLVIELYGSDTTLTQPVPYRSLTGLCCPKTYTKTRYQWLGNAFKQVDKAQVFPHSVKEDDCQNCYVR